MLLRNLHWKSKCLADELEVVKSRSYMLMNTFITYSPDIHHPLYVLYIYIYIEIIQYIIT